MSKNVLILGGNSDIAKACAKVFFERGHTITLASRNTTEIEQYCTTNNLTANILPFDALAYKSHEAFYQTLAVKPTLVICAFGYLADNLTAFQNFDEAEKTIDTNYKGAVSILNVVAKHFQSERKGCIIGISSVAADRGRASNLLYSSSKAGFDAYLSGLRNMLYSFGVHVITVKPGFVATKMVANHPTIGALTAAPEQVAKKIVTAYHRKRNVVYNNGMWRMIMTIIKCIPEFIFKRLKL